MNNFMSHIYNLDKTYKFLEMNKLRKLTLEEIESMKNILSEKHFEFIANLTSRLPALR